MTLSAILATVGDQNVLVQHLANDITAGSIGKKGATVTFATDPKLVSDLNKAAALGRTPEKIGLVIWIDAAKWEAARSGAQPVSAAPLTLRFDGDSGDGKRAFVVADQNDGWKDLRIEVDTDDCDRDHAKAMMQFVIDRVNGHQALAAERDNYKRAVEEAHAALDACELMTPRSISHGGLRQRVEKLIQIATAKGGAS